MDRETVGSCEQYHAWLRLRHCRRLPPPVALKLAAALGSAEAVLAASTNRLRELVDNRNISDRILFDCDEEGVQRDIAWAGQSDRNHILTWADGRYPSLLREIPDPPLLLYVRGEPACLESYQIAIVGSRNPTPGGRSLSFRFARNLSRAGFTITSGLAIGIDAAAHEGTLAASGPTIAVMATGPDRVYPARHRNLAGDIEATGALVSERPVGAKPTRWSFPGRNRIISGLSIGTLVVEATERSGSLITARTAGDQGREVYAIPGSIHSPLSRGCHTLIRDGAGLVESEDDILGEIGLVELPRRHPPVEGGRGDSDNLLLSSMGYDPVAIDTIVQRSGLTADKVCSILLRLEMQGLVEAVTGGHYVRIG